VLQDSQWTGGLSVWSSRKEAVQLGKDLSDGDSLFRGSSIGSDLRDDPGKPDGRMLYPTYRFRGYSELGVNPFPNPINLCIIVWKWGKYLGAGAIDDGVDVCVSSWTRIAPNTLPALAKCGANYMNSQLIKMEALLGGYAEGIALDAAGYVSEGSGENLFIVCEGKLITPPLGASVLPGITRDCVIRLAADLEIPVVEKIVPREMLYLADEVFFTGSAAEITPIRSIDKIKIAPGNEDRSPKRSRRGSLDSRR